MALPLYFASSSTPSLSFITTLSKSFPFTLFYAPHPPSLRATLTVDSPAAADAGGRGTPKVLLEVKNLRDVIAESKQEILRGVNLTINEGEVHAIIGKNGRARSRRLLVPDGCDLVAAGALPVAFGTSHVALVHRAQLKPGQVLLVLGAAGGVGFSAVQIGKVCGAVVIAVARGVEKVQFLQSLGVDHVVDLSKGNVIESVKQFLKTKRLKGVDVLYDPVGGNL